MFQSSPRLRKKGKYRGSRNRVAASSNERLVQSRRTLFFLLLFSDAALYSCEHTQSENRPTDHSCRLPAAMHIRCMHLRLARLLDWGEAQEIETLAACKREMRPHDWQEFEPANVRRRDFDRELHRASDAKSGHR